MRLNTCFVLVFLLMSAAVAQAKQIERACLSSDRGAGQRGLCGCIQDAANRTLSQKDQKLAASFFKEPDKAQRIRQSDSRNHERFWDRYKNFAQTAETYCGK